MYVGETVAEISLNPPHARREDGGELKVPFDKIRGELDFKLKKCNERIAPTEKLHLSTAEINDTLEETYVNSSNEQNEWKDVKTKLAKQSLHKKVKLNVGDDRNTTSIDTLTRENDTFSRKFFSQKWELELDEIDKRLFIDRNGQIFTYILEYLRTDTAVNDVINNESPRQSYD